jgi:hypothetical protein
MEQTLQGHRVAITDTRRLLCPNSPFPSWFPAQLQKTASRHSRSREGLAAPYSATIQPRRRVTFTYLRYYHVQPINTEPVSLCHVRIDLGVGYANLVAHKSGKEGQSLTQTQRDDWEKHGPLNWGNFQFFIIQDGVAVHVIFERVKGKGRADARSAPVSRHFTFLPVRLSQQHVNVSSILFIVAYASGVFEGNV